MYACDALRMDTSLLMWSGLFSLIGSAVFLYGRRQRRGAPTIAGVALMVYPYFVSTTLGVVGIGALLLAGLLVANRFEDSL
jgi:LPXTG-motif cell wall-anchored protein